jgi:hypothetical protein
MKGISNSKAFGPTWTNEKHYYFGFNKNFYIMDSYVRRKKQKTKTLL